MKTRISIAVIGAEWPAYLTTEHPASSYGKPVVVPDPESPSGTPSPYADVLGPADLSDAETLVCPDEASRKAAEDAGYQAISGQPWDWSDGR